MPRWPAGTGFAVCVVGPTTSEDPPDTFDSIYFELN
jgi:hypothetical protein